MKSKIFILGILSFVIFSFAKATNVESKISSDKTAVVKADSKSAYTYVRVCKDGVCWIYVYDGTILIDIYPEE